MATAPREGVYTLEVRAGAVAFPEDGERMACRNHMFMELSKICRNIVVNDPLENGGLNLHGQVDPFMTLDDLEYWQIEGLKGYDKNASSSVGYTLTDIHTGIEHSATYKGNGEFTIYVGEDDMPETVTVHQLMYMR